MKQLTHELKDGKMKVLVRISSMQEGHILLRNHSSLHTLCALCVWWLKILPQAL